MTFLDCFSISTLPPPKAPFFAATTTGRWDSLVFIVRPTWAPARLNIGAGLLGLCRNSRSELRLGWSFIGGRSILFRHKVIGKTYRRNGFRGPSASWLTSSQIATNAFTWGTVAVLPFYTLMVVAPDAALTRKTMESAAPYVALGLLYAYLLYLSWTPDTLRAMFASKYWLPEVRLSLYQAMKLISTECEYLALHWCYMQLAGIAKMFSNEMTVASAWIHLLAVDLFAARQVFHDGLNNRVETRHSVSLCLLFCPIGIVTHAVTKLLTKTRNRPH